VGRSSHRNLLSVTPRACRTPDRWCSAKRGLSPDSLSCERARRDFLITLTMEIPAPFPVQVKKSAQVALRVVQPLPRMTPGTPAATGSNRKSRYVACRRCRQRYQHESRDRRIAAALRRRIGQRGSRNLRDQPSDLDESLLTIRDRNAERNERERIDIEKLTAEELGRFWADRIEESSRRVLSELKNVSTEMGNASLIRALATRTRRRCRAGLPRRRTFCLPIPSTGGRSGLGGRMHPPHAVPRDTTEETSNERWCRRTRGGPRYIREGACH
jgi:hypothetical protein